MAKDKFVPIPLIPEDQPDDSSAAPEAPPSEQGAPAPSPLTEPSTIAAANTPAIQRTPQQQAQVADAVAREQDGQNRRALVLAAEAIRKKYPADGDRTPDPEEQKILDVYEQEYGQGNLKNAEAQAQAENMPTALKPLVAAGEGVADAVDKAGFAMGVGSGEYKPTVPGGATGAVTKNVTQFVSGMAATLATMNGQGIQEGAGKLADAGRLAFGAALGGSAAQDLREENLSNLIEQHSTLAKPITDFLAARPDDTNATAFFKKFCENAGLGLATDGLLASLKFLKTGRAVQAGDKAAVGSLQEAHEELQGLIHQALSPEGSYLRATPEAVAPVAAEKVAAPAVTTTAEAAKPVIPAPANPKQLISPEMADKLRASVEDHKDLIQGGIDFNFKHLPDNPDALAMINEVSKVLEPVMGDATGGVRSLQSTKDLADIVGLKPAEVLSNVSRLAGLAKNADVTITSGKALFVSLADQIDKQSTLINTMKLNGENTAKEQAEMLKLVNIHAQLQMDLKGAITGTARATGAGRIDIKALGVQNMEEAAQLFAMADGNPVAIGKLIRPLTTGEKVAGGIAEWRANCLLSGTTTLAKKATADALNAVALPAAKIIGGVLHGNMGAIRDGAATYIGLTKSLGDAFAMARKALNNGSQILDASAGVTQPTRNFISSADRGVVGTLVNALGSITRMPTRLIGTLDEFSKQLNYRAAVYSQATREGAAKGFTGDNLAQFIEDSASKAFDAQGRGINEQALQYAKEATFTQDLDYGIGKWLQDGTNNHPLVRAVLPFVKVPTNLFRQAWAYTPGLQMLQRQWAEDLKAGGTRAAMARGKQVIGAMMYAQAVNLATSGRITGSGPRDPEARKALLDTGWQPYSFKVGDKYLSYAWLDPYATPFGLVADFAEAAGQMNNDTAEKTAVAMSLALAHHLTSRTYYKGMVDMLDGMRGDENQMMKTLQSFAGSFVPNTRQFTDILPQTQDPYLRECQTIMDGIRKKIPGWSQTLAPTRNLFGDPIPMPAAFGPDTLSPFHESTGTNDKLLNELAKFPKGFSLPSKKIGNVDLSQLPSKEGGFDAYDRLLQLNGSVKISGKDLKTRLTEFINSEKYQKLTDDGPGYSGSKFEAISSLIADHRAAAQKALLKENEGVKAAVRGDQTNHKNAMKNGPQAVTPLQSLMGALTGHPQQ